ncbi:MAG TPA: DMT family transporter [Candidatus Thermoplasmatota archaeon]
MTHGTTIALGLAGAASWGTADFCGGVASRKADPYVVILVSQFIGLMLLVVGAVALDQPLSGLTTLAWGAAVGLVGIVGIVSLYRGLAIGPMSVVAPVSGVFAAAIPIPVSIALEGWPGAPLFLGFGFGLVGIWLVARGSGSLGRISRTPLLLGILAGASFGVFYILLDQAGEGGLLWPLASARVTSVIALAPIVLMRRASLPATGRVWLLTALAGGLDAGGNVFFILVAQLGRLDVASVLLSLYPAATAIIAFLVLKERLGRTQVLGLIAMAAAIVLMTSF